MTNSVEPRTFLSSIEGSTKYQGEQQSNTSYSQQHPTGKLNQLPKHIREQCFGSDSTRISVDLALRDIDPDGNPDTDA